MSADQALRGAAWFRLLKKVRFPQAHLSALKYAADPTGQWKTEMVGEPWCNFLQHLLMRFARLFTYEEASS